MGCNCLDKSDKIVVSIDREKLQKGDMYNVALLSFASNPKEFETKLNDLGIEFDENPYEDIKVLVRLNELGGDINGMLKNKNGKQIKFDFKEFIKEIQIDESNNNPIKVDFI